MTPASVMQRAQEAAEAFRAEHHAEAIRTTERRRAEALSSAAARARDVLELGPEDAIALELADNGVAVILDEHDPAGGYVLWWRHTSPGVLWAHVDCSAGHGVDVQVRNLVDLGLVQEHADGRCTTCNVDPEPVPTWSVSVVAAGDSKALVEALDDHPPHDVMVVAGGEYLHVIGGFDA
jgi:hypothetical protein